MRGAAATAFAFGLVLCGGAPAWAQTGYPFPTVTLVTHSSPGGGSDVFVRSLAKHLGPKR